MFRDVAKQMIPFFILLAVLWVTAEILERTLAPGYTIIAPPAHVQPAPAADAETAP